MRSVHISPDHDDGRKPRGRGELLSQPARALCPEALQRTKFVRKSLQLVISFAFN